jgi:chromosome partitioning protein
MTNGKIVALCGQKGGSGKTTTAEAIAGELVARGQRVLLVDADPQGTARTWADVAAENGHVCPTAVAMGASMHQPSQLPRLLGSYDTIIVDCPPRHSEIQRSALMAADVAILPCGPSAHDVWAMATSIDLVNDATRVRSELQAFILITRKAANTVIGQGARAALAELGVPILRSELHYRVAYQEAPAAGLGVAQYAPTDAAAGEVKSLVDELEEVLHAQKTSTHRAAKARRRG